MEKQKVWIIYLGTSFAWLSLSSLAIPALYGYSIATKLSGIWAVILMFLSLHLFRNASELAIKFTKDKDKKRLTLVILSVVGVAIFELLAWYYRQKSLNPHPVFNLYLASGSGLIIVTVVFWIIAIKQS